MYKRQPLVDDLLGLRHLQEQKYKKRLALGEDIQHLSLIHISVDAKNGAFEDTADEKSFVSLRVTDGEGELTCGGETVVVKKGDSFFLPAGSGSYAVRGTCQTLVTRV